MEKKLGKITPESLYTTRLKARLVEGNEGWTRREEIPVEPTKVGDAVLDCVSERLATQDVPSVKTLAGELGITIDDLNAIFKFRTGMLTRIFLNRYKICLANELLASTDLPHAEIAKRCGFKKTNSFTQFYIRTTGMPPSEYRKRNRQSNFRELYKW